jgi:hypothetical protein
MRRSGAFLVCPQPAYGNRQVDRGRFPRRTGAVQYQVRAQARPLQEITVVFIPLPLGIYAPHGRHEKHGIASSRNTGNVISKRSLIAVSTLLVVTVCLLPFLAAGTTGILRTGFTQDAFELHRHVDRAWARSQRLVGGFQLQLATLTPSSDSSGYGHDKATSQGRRLRHAGRRPTARCQ